MSPSLEVELPATARRSVPVSAGLHPYFATPEGAATVLSGSLRRRVSDLLPQAVTVSLEPVVYVDIPGVGLVRMVMYGALRDGAKDTESTARLVIWRDSLDYLCVEPVLAKGTDFDTPACPHVEPGGKLSLACEFQLA